MQSMVPRFLEQAMGALAQQQEQMREAMHKTMGSIGTMFPFGNMEEVGRQNMAMMERAFSLFTPFYRGAESGDINQGQEIAALRAEVENLRRQLEEAKTKA
jgi:polyhydroxyalkanoate synthesis regulator protein